jgi:hypothetical protein
LRQNKSTKKFQLISAIGKMYLTDMYRILHPKATDFTFFSEANVIFCKIDHILVNKTSPNKYKEVETFSCILSDYNGMKIEINNKIDFRSYRTSCKSNDRYTFKCQVCLWSMTKAIRGTCTV